VLCRVFNKTDDHNDGLLGLYHVSSWGAGCSLFLNAAFQQIINQQTGPWGVKVTTVEVKSVACRRRCNGPSRAKRKRSAKVIHAEGEFEASQGLADAADVIDRNPVALQLRYLQTLVEISADKNSTTIFPIPIDTIAPFLKGLTQK
jgi:regulator of protease activity HflC (stomatin/prohibitin superfamily)